VIDSDEVFDDRFDHQIAIRELRERLRAAHRRQRGTRAELVELAFGREFREGFGKVIARRTDRGGVAIEQAHLEPGKRGDLCNTTAHRTAADDADGFDRDLARGVERHDLSKLRTLS
jgi:hypothetical protein